MSDLPLGDAVDWVPARCPVLQLLSGAHVLLRPVDAQADAAPLYALTHAPDGDPSVWAYLPDGPYQGAAQLQSTLSMVQHAGDPLYFTIERTGEERPLGLIAYMRITPEFGAIEIGGVVFSKPLQRTIAASEAVYLLLRHAFEELGYRRVEWKCNALNAASRRAAARFGFAFEGIFRQHMIIKGRNRDTAWFAMLDREWPRIRAGFEAWLDPNNFDQQGFQRSKLTELIAAASR